MTTQLRIFSYGGGVQSTAALVLAAQGKIDFPVFLFANVGDDSEHPATLRYVREVAMPYAAAQGIDLVELRRAFKRGERAGREETLYSRLTREGGRSLAIPVRMESGAPASRSCTMDFKVRRLADEQKARGATVTNPAVTGLGISLDEWQRMKTDSGIAWQILEYPLIDMRLTRQDCMNIISAAGLPVPPKSSCWFCPYHSLAAWRDLKANEPRLFDRAVALETYLRERHMALGKGPVWLTDKLIPLEQAVAGTQHTLFDEDDACESGFCMT